MALYNEILVGRFNRALQKFLSMKGGAPAAQLSSDIQPGFVFPIGNEFRYLESWFRYGSRLTVAADAAATGGYRMRNPVGSNVIAVVEKIAVNVAVTAGLAFDHGLAVGVPDLATIQPSIQERFDSRGQVQPTVVRSSQSTPAVLGAGTTKWEATCGAGQVIDIITDEQQEVTILPNDFITVRSTAVNTAFTTSWWWRERALEESERT